VELIDNKINFTLTEREAYKVYLYNDNSYIYVVHTLRWSTDKCTAHVIQEKGEGTEAMVEEESL
jgi:hypothetical protein